MYTKAIVNLLIVAVVLGIVGIIMYDDSMYSKMFDNKTLQALDAFAEKTKIPAVHLKPVRRKTTVFESKFGGTPYLPPGFSYPCDTYPGSGRPLALLAQLNFAELPRLAGFPDHGILQFYCSHHDFREKFFGANMGDVANQSGFKVVYHENIITDESLLGTLPEGAIPATEYFPFKGEFALLATLVDSVPIQEDYRFDDIVTRFVRDNPSFAYILSDDAAPDDFGGILTEDFSEAIHEYFHYQRKLVIGSRIGGYPHFVQWDPRGEGYTTLLLQIDSENYGRNWYESVREDAICWGDAGVANFFIEPEDLAKLDFSRLIFYWDCS